MCKGFNAPPGSSETTGLPTVFVFNGIKPTATVDEGHNWLNLAFGPLTLNRSAVQQASANPPELMVASVASGINSLGAYSIGGTSAAVNRGTNTGLPAATASDFFGNPRARNSGNPTDIGAVEYQIAANSTLVVANPSPLVFNTVVGTTATQDVTVSNNGTTAFVFTAGTGAVSGSTALTRLATGVTGNCPTAGATAAARTLAAGASCVIRVQFAAPANPATGQTITGSLAIVGSATVTNAPVTITANALAATFTATVGPNPLDFGNWATGTTSAPLMFTVNNTGNSPLANLAFGFGATANFTRVTNGVTFPAYAPNCGTTLAVGATCSVAVQFAPGPTTGPISRNLTVTATGATITTSPVVLTGSGVTTRATAAVMPSPMTITLTSLGTPSAQSLTATGVVSLVNTAPAGGSNLYVTGATVTTSQGSVGVFTAGPLAGPDTCTGAALPPGGTCSVSVRYTAGLNRSNNPTGHGTITFTDSASNSPQTGALQGIPTP